LKQGQKAMLALLGLFDSNNQKNITLQDVRARFRSEPYVGKGRGATPWSVRLTLRRAESSGHLMTAPSPDTIPTIFEASWKRASFAGFSRHNVATAGKHETKYVLCFKLDDIANWRWPAKSFWWLIYVNQRS
jgi:hypothetical protein